MLFRSLLYPQTRRSGAGEEGEHGRLPAAAERTRAVDTDPFGPQVGVRGDDDGGGAAAEEYGVVLVRGVLRLLLRLLMAHLLLPMAVELLLLLQMAVELLLLLMFLPELMPVQLVPLI